MEGRKGREEVRKKEGKKEVYRKGGGKERKMIKITGLKQPH